MYCCCKLKLPFDNTWTSRYRILQLVDNGGFKVLSSSCLSNLCKKLFQLRIPDFEILVKSLKIEEEVLKSQRTILDFRSKESSYSPDKKTKICKRFVKIWICWRVQEVDAWEVKSRLWLYPILSLIVKYQTREQGTTD